MNQQVILLIFLLATVICFILLINTNTHKEHKIHNNQENYQEIDPLQIYHQGHCPCPLSSTLKAGISEKNYLPEDTLINGKCRSNCYCACLDKPPAPKEEPTKSETESQPESSESETRTIHRLPYYPWFSKDGVEIKV